MKTIDLSNFGPVISNRDVGDTIYKIIRSAVDKYENVDVDLKSIQSMATFNAKQVFGQLYLELGPQNFFRQVKLLNATDDLKLIIRISIQNALEDAQVA